MEKLKLEYDGSIVSRYKDLNYKLWYAIAEFIDNSTQSYFDNESEIKKVKNEKLDVSISLENGKSLIIIDNAFGMDDDDLKDLLILGRKKPKSKSGKQRSEFGMGLKTGGFWIGKKISVVTKKLSSKYTYRIILDSEKISAGDNSIEISKSEEFPENKSLTRIEITDFHRKFSSHTIKKTKESLRSMYNKDILNGVMTLRWENESFEPYKREVFKYDGKEYKWNIDFEINGKKINGYVGLLQKGTRADAGFEISRNGRNVACYPEFYKPFVIYGQDQGTNDLVNQRVFGELEFDQSFGISQSKDQIMWDGDEEDKFMSLIEEVSAEAVSIAKKTEPKGGIYKKKKGGKILPPTSADDIQKELESPEIDDLLADIRDLYDDEVAREEANDFANRVIENSEATYNWKLGKIRKISVYCKELNESSLYIAYKAEDVLNINVIINTSHPHYTSIESKNDNILIENYIKTCCYDALIEYTLKDQDADENGKITPESFRYWKDRFLRSSFGNDF